MNIVDKVPYNEYDVCFVPSLYEAQGLIPIDYIMTRNTCLHVPKCAFDMLDYVNDDETTVILRDEDDNVNNPNEDHRTKFRLNVKKVS